MAEPPSHPPLRSYGRIKSRAIKPRQAALMDTLLPRIALDPSAGVDLSGAAEVWLEIGFGGGEHLVAQGQRHPGVLLLGAEPFLNGAASALRHIDEARLDNVRLFIGDARDLLAALPDASLDRVFILFPDPWPKARHHKRRLLQDDVAADLARVLKPGGRLRFATDWGDYADWALERLSKVLHWTAETADGWRTPPADHVTTRYESKRLGDIDPVFLDFIRSPPPRLSGGLVGETG
jgi:tRNA (guanine-N7-)-methyltransferase